ncbi:MAG: N-6 DNA methylase [Bacteroidales bacterium]|nr:N-6 DNA methylase [Bacteroidales bacterium]
MIVAGYDNKPKEVKPISLDELEKYLWGAAVLLRGQIDATSYKEYIFPLVFFKRLCDVFDEAYADAMVLSDGDDEYSKLDAEQRVATIPFGAHWNDVREVTENIGQALVTALTRIEQANPPIELYGRRIGGLSGIFGPKQIWTNKSNMPDRLISDLLEHFSQLNLSLAACPADEMGTGYEYLVGKFADDAGHTAQEFYTNRTVVDLMTRILKPQPGESIYDPTCGSGGMLIKCLTAVRDQGKEWRGMKVFGQELNALTASIARMNLFLHGVQEYSIVNGDTLSDPAFIQNGHLQRFDIVLANPPYSISQWNRAAFASDKYGRNDYGVPPQARADYAFIQHIICSLDPAKGRSAVLLPHGVLNRDEEASIRQAIVEDDVIEAIIGLGRNLFYNSGLESCVIIFNKNKPINRVGKILFVEAEKCTHKIKSQAYLFKEDIDKIMTAFETEDDIPGFSAIVDNSEILLNYGNLNIKLYVKSEDPIEDDSKEKVNSVLVELESVQSRLSESVSGLLNVQNQPNPPMPSFPIDLLNKSNWIKVRLGDVASEYSERIDNPSESEYDDFIGSNCIDQYDFRIERTSPASQVTSAQKKFCVGDYLLVRRSLYGSDFRERAPRAQFDGVCSADIITIRENPRLIADGYLINILYSKALWDFIVSKSTGGLTRRIKWKQLAGFEFLLPPKDVQTKISHLLWASYDMKMSYKAMLSSVDEYVKSQFIEDYFNRYEPTNLGPFISVIRGVSYKPADIKESAEDGVTILRSNNISDGEINYDDLVYVSDLCVSQKQYLRSGDIVMCGSNGSKKLVGKAGLFTGEHGNTSFGAFCLGIRCNDNLSSEYLNAYFNSDMYRSIIEELGNGTNIINIRPDHITSLAIPIPNIEAQKRFVSMSRQADKSKFELKQAIEKIDNVMRALMQ